MTAKIGIIREEMQAADIQKLPAFIKAYEDDSRTGVKALVERARKKLTAFEKERLRMERMWVYEREYESCTYICGIDEAGRGPLAGPVVAGAVILPKDCDILYLNDSKQLSAKKREELYDIIRERAVCAGIGGIGSRRIDETDILRATYEAMRQAIADLIVEPDILLNDAVTIPQVNIRQVPIVKGDAKSASIAAASILAKVTRDRMMTAYDNQYPGYGFAAHKGYGSQEHIAALRRLGPCPIHRKLFIRNFL